MAEQSLLKLWAEVEAELLVLRAEFLQSEKGLEAAATFDRYIEANELGLALDELAFFLIESDAIVGAPLAEAILRLYSKMGVEDECSELLRIKAALGDGSRREPA